MKKKKLKKRLVKQEETKPVVRQRIVGGNYYKCLGCSNLVNADVERGKCSICESQNWIACTDV